MMLQNFLKKFKITQREIVNVDTEMDNSISKELSTLFSLFGGCTFNDGLYRIHSSVSSLHWMSIIGDYFNGYNNEFFPFAFDWMGRHFCLGKHSNLIFMFDPATGEDFQLQQNLVGFHEHDLVGDMDEMLAANLYREVCKTYKIKSLRYSECLGYKVPLFLGGKDSIGNYEKQDLEVYWHIQNQIYEKTKNLPEGTKIGDVKVDK